MNNMLAGITGNLYLAKKDTTHMPFVNERLSNIEKLSFRAANMIKQLLTFDDTAPHQQPDQSIIPYDATGKLILLADDQPYVLETAQQVLEAMGYKTLIAENGQRAVELYRTHAAEIDLCIFDVVMPIMGGDKAAKEIRLGNNPLTQLRHFYP